MSNLNPQEEEIRNENQMNEKNEELLEEEEIAKLVLDFYNTLPSNGKPKNDYEYTVLASFVAVIDTEEYTKNLNENETLINEDEPLIKKLKTNDIEKILNQDNIIYNNNESSNKRLKSIKNNKEYYILSLATGTKSLGHSLIDKIGTTISDSHAEILAHRSLLKLFQQVIIRLLIENKLNLTNNDLKFQNFSNHLLCPFNIHYNNNNISFTFKKNWKIVLYISDPLCGDASIYSRNFTENVSEFLTGAKAFGYNLKGNEINPVVEYLNYRDKLYHKLKKKKFNKKDKEESNEDNKNLKEEEVEEEEEENQETPLGWIRTKSGRSDLPTSSLSLSLSCSDKVTKWVQLGLQGSFLYDLIGFIPLDTVIIGLDPTATSKECQLEAMERVFHTRCSPNFELNYCQEIKNNFQPNKIKLKILSDKFSFINSKNYIQNKYWNDIKDNKKSPTPCGSNINWYLDYYSPFFFYTRINQPDDNIDKYSIDFNLFFNEIINIYDNYINRINQYNLNINEDNEKINFFYSNLLNYLKDTINKYIKTNLHEKNSFSIYSFQNINENYFKLIDKLKNLKFYLNLGQIEVTISHTGLLLGSSSTSFSSYFSSSTIESNSKNNKKENKKNEKLKISRISPLSFRLFQEIILLIYYENIINLSEQEFIFSYKKWKKYIKNVLKFENFNENDFFSLPIFNIWKKKSQYFIDN